MTTKKPAMSTSLRSVLCDLGIDAEVQARLVEQHDIVDYATLKCKQYYLDRKQLDGIDTAVQETMSGALFYADALQTTKGCKDPFRLFTLTGWMNYAASMGLHSSALPEEESKESEDHGGFGESTATALFKLDLKPDADKNVTETTPLHRDGSGDMEIDDVGDESDPFKVSTERKNRKKVKPVEREGEVEEGKEPEQQTKFGMMPQGFENGKSNLLADLGEFGTHNQKEVKVLQSVYDVKGRCFQKGKCYHYTDEDGKAFVVGIKSFVTEKVAMCVEVAHISKTFLGQDDADGSFANAVASHYPTMFAQIEPPLKVAVAKLGDESEDPHPVDLPQLIFEPRKRHEQMSFGYVRDNDYSNIVRVPRKDIRMIEGFSGAGGMHIGYAAQGFTTVRAVEWCPKAVKTFEHNNPGVPVFCGDILEFIKMMEEQDGVRQALGRIDVVHVSSPCQGFSTLNPGTTDPEVDKKRNELSYTLPQLLKLTGALVGVLENVQGMWVKGKAYLKKILIDCIAMGYQVRVRVIYARNYGDPQVRPRLIIMAAKNFVQMPNHPVPTHGQARHLKPFVKCGDVLEYLRTPQAQELPNMERLNLHHSEPVKIFRHNFAPAMLASKTAYQHYAQDRCLTVREAAVLQSFPLDYEFLGTIQEQFRQIGNAVPCEMSRSIARSVRESLHYQYAEEQATHEHDGSSEEGQTENGMNQGAAMEESNATEVVYEV